MTGWGILATGFIAELFTSDLKQNGHSVTAVGSRSQKSADAFAARFDIPNAHASYQDLVSDPDVDIVYVATPHPYHLQNATLALDAGKHVLIEKPIALNAAQAQQLADLAADKGLLLLEAMWTRFLPHMARVREIIAAGTLGEVRTLIVDHTQDLPDDPAHRINDLALGGGALLDLGIYPISFSWDLFGKPVTISAQATFKPTGADAQVATVFGYGDGRVASTLSASDTRGPNTASILGTKARIEMDAVWYNPTSFRVIDAGGSVIETYESDVVGRGMQFQAQEAERVLASGQTSSALLSPQESVAIMRTLDEVRSQIGLVYPGE